jgi:hypothetical protein
MTTVPSRADRRWRKSRRSYQATDCVELAPEGLVRDSKNPAGPILPVNIPALLVAVKTNQIN